MQEVDALDFYERVVDEESETRERTLEHQSGATVSVDLTVVDRKDLLDEINKLPDEMLETISEAEDPEEAEERARSQNLLSGVTGETVEAFENICIESIEHEQWTSHHVEDVVSELDFEVLFPIGAEIIEFSFEDQGSITDFHEPGSDRSS